MGNVVFSPSEFKAEFPAFAGKSDDTLTATFSTSTIYIANDTCSSLGMSGTKESLYLMTAHLLALGDIIAAGQTPGVEQSATIDKVSVTMQPPPNKNQFQWWLNTTPYGQRLLALLQMKSVGGHVVGGNPELDAFRKAYGVF